MDLTCIVLLLSSLLLLLLVTVVLVFIKIREREFLDVCGGLVLIIFIACFSYAIIDGYTSQHEEQVSQMEHIDDEAAERLVVVEDADENRYEVLESDLNPVD